MDKDKKQSVKDYYNTRMDEGHICSNGSIRLYPGVACSHCDPYRTPVHVDLTSLTQEDKELVEGIIRKVLVKFDKTD